jgi:hypothetical protein
MTTSTKIHKLPQYTMAFLAGSFGLTVEQATSIIAEAGDDRLKAAEAARLQKKINN